MARMKAISVLLVKEKRTSAGRERGSFASIVWGSPSAYTSQLSKNREEQLCEELDSLNLENATIIYSKY